MSKINYLLLQASVTSNWTSSTWSISSSAMVCWKSSSNAEAELSERSNRFPSSTSIYAVLVDGINSLKPSENAKCALRKGDITTVPIPALMHLHRPMYGMCTYFFELATTNFVAWQCLRWVVIRPTLLRCKLQQFVARITSPSYFRNSVTASR